MRRFTIVVLVLVAAFAMSAGRAAAVTYFIEVQSSPGGVVSPSGMVEVVAGGSQTFTFTPSGCLQVGQVTVDDVPVGTGISQYTFTNVQADHILYVPFGPGATATSLEVRPVAGQCAVPETLIATVANGNGGEVRFYQGTALLGTKTLAGNTASYVIANGSPSGSYVFTARYVGNACNGSSDSPEVGYDVLETGPATMSLSFDLPRMLPPETLMPIQSTFRINGVVAGRGQVTFYDNGTVAATVPMQNGLAGFGASTSVSGVHAWTAVARLTDCVDREVASEPETVLVVNNSTSTSFTIAPTSADSGQSVVLTAVVAPSLATGIVEFVDITHEIVSVGTAPVVDGVASLTYGPLSGPSRTLRAEYKGDGYFFPSDSDPANLRVMSRPRLEFTVAPTSVEFGNAVQLAATISPLGVPGVVHFDDLTQGGEVGTATIFGGYSATLLLVPSAAGGRWLRARYDGDAEHYPALSDSVYLDVTMSPLCGAPQTYATGARPRGLAVGDMDADGHLDIVTVNSTAATVSVLGGNGDGTFAPRIDSPVSQAGARSIALADVNADGRLDAVTGGDRVSVLLGQGNGTLVEVYDTPGAFGRTSVAIADLDGDGRPDFAVTSESYWRVFVFLGNGDGTFRAGSSYDTGPIPKHVAIADLNGDSWPDLAVADEYEYVVAGHGSYTSGGVSVLLGSRGGVFTPRTGFRTSCDSPMSVAIADVNGDGRLDLVTADRGLSNPCTNISLLRGFGDGTFNPSQSFGVFGGLPALATIGDFDADGRWDVAEVNDPGNHQGTLSLLRGMGGGSFQRVAVCAPGGDYSAVAIVDLDRDGGPDLVVSDWNANVVRVFRNTHPSAPVSVGNEGVIGETGVSLIAPNPSRATSRIEYTVARAGRVRLAVTDVAGRVVATLFDGLQQPGRFTVAWDGTSGGARLPAGLYFVRLRTPDRVVSRTIARLR